ncbi:hypothetical protein Ancab_030509 [Ancistrocladus abbreviatus]
MDIELIFQCLDAMEQRDALQFHDKMEERLNDEIKNGAFNEYDSQETKTTHSHKLSGKKEKGADKYPIIPDSSFRCNRSKAIEDSPRWAYNRLAGKSSPGLNSNGGGVAILEPTHSVNGPKFF